MGRQGSETLDVRLGLAAGSATGSLGMITTEGCGTVGADAK